MCVLESGLAVIKRRARWDVAQTLIQHHPRDPLKRNEKEGRDVLGETNEGTGRQKRNPAHVNGNNGINGKAAWTWNKGYLRGRARALDVLPTLKSASCGCGADNALTQCSAEVCTRIITCQESTGIFYAAFRGRGLSLDRPRLTVATD